MRAGFISLIGNGPLSNLRYLLKLLIRWEYLFSICQSWFTVAVLLLCRSASTV